MTTNNYLKSLSLLLVFLLIQCKPNANDTSPQNSGELTSYLNKGKEIASESFAVLSSNLMNAVKKGGVKNAIDFCNLNAMSIVDSLSKVHNATIKRTSIKIRNPKDTADETEVVQLLKYQDLLHKGKEIGAEVKFIDSSTVKFFAPIFVSEPCLKCHGELGKTLHKDDYLVIKEKYPNDAAINYKNGDFRGMWSIKFLKNK